MKRSTQIMHSIATFEAISIFGTAFAQDIQYSGFLTDYSFAEQE